MIQDDGEQALLEATGSGKVGLSIFLYYRKV